MYRVIIFDIKSSRLIEDREGFQRILIRIIDECNAKYEKHIVCPFCITCGDEWEGLLKMEAPTKEIINFFSSKLPKGILFYTGVGEGELSIYDFSYPVNHLDGPAFFKAREEINKAKIMNKPYLCSY